nr:sensor histidine kinase [Methanobacterium formicicum]
MNVCLNCEDVFLEIDTAISLGLIVNELVSNCFKHAFPGSRKGNIEINLLMVGGECKLEVVDDGVGLSGDFDLNHTNSLGLQIVQTLTMQLKGNLEIDKENKTLFRVLFNAN